MLRFPLEILWFQFQIKWLPLETKRFPLEIKWFHIEIKGFSFQIKRFPLEINGFPLEIKVFFSEIEGYPLELGNREILRYSRIKQKLDNNHHTFKQFLPGMGVYTIAEDISQIYSIKKILNMLHLLNLKKE